MIEPVYDSYNVLISAKIPRSLHKDIKESAARRGTTLTDIVVESLRKYMKEQSERQISLGFVK